jgi:hypothetical protein
MGGRERYDIQSEKHNKRRLKIQATEGHAMVPSEVVTRDRTGFYAIGITIALCRSLVIRGSIAEKELSVGVILADLLAAS